MDRTAFTLEDKRDNTQKYNLIVYSDENVQPIQSQIDKYINSHLVKS